MCAMGEVVNLDTFRPVLIGRFQCLSCGSVWEETYRKGEPAPMNRFCQPCQDIGILLTDDMLDDQ